MDKSTEITEMLHEWSDGDATALDKILPFVYDELHRQAARFLRRERPNHTLQTTDLINETYLKLIDQKNARWESRTHFFAICAKLMRRILVDYARARHREKRGGEISIRQLGEAEIVGEDERNIDLMALDEALTHLEKIDAQAAQVVELRYFSGLSLEETAEVLKISRATAARNWAMAKAWLRRELTR